ncbi:anti-sigma factor family protein [Actinomycetospora termitidis]|uniref:Zf-HC2 domain-containing protein n=1 Tax=Actinomycetospora termitidis TaxID=3053470 RepID=A0ABT7M8Y8_9PSEU|nr:zf-HC2 domain-containing protein [Actinomycetospora sp. Odt1-22]MDL5157140.1 zf-HC2 domain-containing protein [Actinomycetospora sp. Odt1-22]
MTTWPDGRDHEVLRDRLGAYVLDGLDAEERAEVDAHLPGCPSCRTELDRIAPLAGPLRALDPDRVGTGPRHGAEESPPEGLAEVLRRVRAEADPPGVAPPAPVVPLAPRRRRPLLLLAAGALVIALAGAAGGFALGVRGAGGPVEPVLVQALAPGVEAEAGTIAHTWGVEVVLTGRGFEPGRTYQVAVVDRTGRPIGAGAFVGTGATEMVCRLNSPVLRDEATGFVVTTGQGDEVLRSRFV